MRMKLLRKHIPCNSVIVFIYPCTGISFNIHNTVDVLGNDCCLQ